MLTCNFTHIPTETSYLNFHVLGVESHFRDPQQQVGENYPYLFNSRPNIFKSSCLYTHFIPTNSDYGY